MERQTLVWLIAGAVAVVAAIVLLRLLWSTSTERRLEDERSAPGIPSTPGAAIPAAGIQTEVPYGIAARPMPQGEDLDTLLPLQVGPYTRESVNPPRGIQQSSYAHYRRGSATIFVELAINADASGARTGVSNAKRETDAEFPDIPQLFIEGPDVSCLRVVVPRVGALMAWTRGRYFFLANAKGGEKDLDEFVKAFPH